MECSLSDLSSDNKSSRCPSHIKRQSLINQLEEEETRKREREKRDETQRSIFT
jgi:hypothetical protein